MTEDKKSTLYVVTNHGQDVESAHGPFDAIIKKFGLAPMIDIFNDILKMLASSLHGYTGLVVLQNLTTQMVEWLETMMAKFSGFKTKAS
jgi:hypothetical protein